MKRTLLLAMLFLLSLSASACSLLSTASSGTTASGSTTTLSTTTSRTTSTSATTSTSITTTTSETTTLPSATTASETTATWDPIQTIDIYSVNDLHGTAYSGFGVLSQMTRYLVDQEAAETNTLILANGDMFQGTALSNYYFGRPIVEILNRAGFDAFTLGNHEFDWGIDKIAAYRDGNPDNGELDCPVLAANIVDKVTGEPMPWTVPYLIRETGGVRIGIIGVIGDVINSISASRVADYEFTDALAAVEDYSHYLHVEEHCDLVLVAMHGYEESVNESLAALSGDYQVDAVFNGHTHQEQQTVLSDETETGMPCVQISDYSGSLIARITLVYDGNIDEVIGVDTGMVSAASLGDSDPLADDIIEEYSTDPVYVAFISEVLATTTISLSRYSEDLQQWGASVIRDYAGVDFGMLNAGGFRVNLPSGELTMGDLITLYPFDNYIKTCEMTGQQLTDFYARVLSRGYDVVFDDGVTYSGGVLYKDGIAVNLTARYTVGAVDYIFDKTNYAFLSGENIATTALLIRDLLAQDLRNTDGFFNPANGTSFGE